MRLRSRVLAAVAAAFTLAAVGCGDNVKEPKKPEGAKELKPQTPGGVPGAGGGAGKPGQGAQ